MTRHGIRRLTALLACTAAATGAALGTGGAAQATTSAKVICLVTARTTSTRATRPMCRWGRTSA